MINNSTHISDSSCIDVIFTSQPNLVVESGVHLSLDPNCHHQIIFTKFNLKIHSMKKTQYLSIFVKIVIIYKY